MQDIMPNICQPEFRLSLASSTEDDLEQCEIMHACDRKRGNEMCYTSTKSSILLKNIFLDCSLVLINYSYFYTPIFIPSSSDDIGFCQQQI